MTISVIKTAINMGPALKINKWIVNKIKYEKQLKSYIRNLRKDIKSDKKTKTRFIYIIKNIGPFTVVLHLIFTAKLPKARGDC